MLRYCDLSHLNRQETGNNTVLIAFAGGTFARNDNSKHSRQARKRRCTVRCKIHRHDDRPSSRCNSHVKRCTAELKAKAQEMIDAQEREVTQMSLVSSTSLGHNWIMTLGSSISARFVMAFMSLLILFCSTLPAFCQCHPAQQTVPASIIQGTKKQSCCKVMEGDAAKSLCRMPCCKPTQKEVSNNTFNNQDCCCKTGTLLHDAVLTTSHSGEESNWTARPDALAPVIAVSPNFADRQRHCVRKLSSTFAPTGPPLYLLHRALLL